jgi:hypothetical protein
MDDVLLSVLVFCAFYVVSIRFSTVVIHDFAPFFNPNSNKKHPLSISQYSDSAFRLWQGKLIIPYIFK